MGQRRSSGTAQGGLSEKAQWGQAGSEEDEWLVVGRVVRVAQGLQAELRMLPRSRFSRHVHPAWPPSLLRHKRGNARQVQCSAAGQLTLAGAVHRAR